MCLFPLPNTDHNSIAYKKGVTEFDCGSCPECLKKRSSVWVLRSVYEARLHVHNCMVTLTYDNFVRDEKGKIIGETPVNPNLKVNQRDVQLFIKRLRKMYSGISPDPVKYIACAEYGSHTHRAHYHVLLFGVDFSDAHFYKKSKRGNPIYMSNTLTKLWGHGICTIDSRDVHSSVAMYCTKYCAKSRSLDTFMLYSQSIGLRALMHDFNGFNYMIDGREYPIPRFVWQNFILNKYSDVPWQFSPRYVNRTDQSILDGSYEKSQVLRQAYRDIRDGDSTYLRYLSYWQRRGQEFDQNKLPVRTRILQLDESKLHNYKVKALSCYDTRSESGVPVIAPGSRAGVSRFLKYIDEKYSDRGIRVDPVVFLPEGLREEIMLEMSRYDSFYSFKYRKYIGHLPLGSRPNTASDTIQSELICDSPDFIAFRQVFPDNFHRRC